TRAVPPVGTPGREARGSSFLPRFVTPSGKLSSALIAVDLAASTGFKRSSRTPDDVRVLVIKIRKESNFGYTRILGELRKLGIRISRQTVKNILKEAGLTPEPDDGADSWEAFLRRHAATLWQCD